MKNLYYLFILSYLLISCEEDTTPLKYTLTTQVSPVEGGSVFPSSGEYNEGDRVTVSATPSKNWKFIKWNGDGNDSPLNPLNVTINSDIILIAEFEYNSDIDGDGILNELDKCPDTPENTDVNEEGCPYIYYEENDITIKASSFTNALKSYKLNGIEYYVVFDKDELIQLLSQGNDAGRIVTSKVKDLSYLFYELEDLNGEIFSWDVSNVTNMEAAFFSNINFINQDISSWDVDNVTNMAGMFQYSYLNSDISSWDVSNVTDMRFMFNQTKGFEQDIGNIGSWDVSKVSNMEGMFKLTSFNQPIGNWDVSKVTNMIEMFDGAINFNQNISNWDVSNVTNMKFMFMNANSFNQPIGNWDVSNVTNMYGMLREGPFNQDLSSWNVSKVTNMQEMFWNSQFDNDISTWDVSNVTNMAKMFQNTPFNGDISKWNVSKVTTMRLMFMDAKQFNKDLSTWDVSSVSECYSFKLDADSYTLPIPNFTLCDPN